MGAASLTLLFYKSFHIESDYQIILFVFLATVFIYTFQRFGKLKIGQAFSGPRLAWMLKNIFLIKLIMALSAIGVGLIALRFNFTTLLFLSPLALVAMLYVGKFPFGLPFNLRDIPFVKVHLIALTWAGMIVLIPITEARLKLEKNHWFFFSAVYLFILSLAIIFDIRDVHLDEPTKKTFPQLFGVKGALVVSAIASVGAFGLFFQVGNYALIPFIAVLIILIVFILNTINRKEDLYYSFYIDGLIVFVGSALCYLVY